MSHTSIILTCLCFCVCVCVDDFYHRRTRKSVPNDRPFYFMPHYIYWQIIRHMCWLVGVSVCLSVRLLEWIAQFCGGKDLQFHVYICLLLRNKWLKCRKKCLRRKLPSWSQAPFWSKIFILSRKRRSPSSPASLFSICVSQFHIFQFLFWLHFQTALTAWLPTNSVRVRLVQYLSVYSSAM